MTVKSSSDNRTDINQQTLVIRQEQQLGQNESVCSRNDNFNQLFQFATLPQALHEINSQGRNSIKFK